MVSTILDAALDYVERGYFVFPLKGKIPLPGSRGLLDATNDKNQVVEWFRDNPDYNIGIACGPSGLVVVDIDTHNENGYDWEDYPKYRDMAGTIVDTPSGGQHLYFKATAETLRNSAERLAPGVDIRGDGGYVVAPPSVGYDFRTEGVLTDIPAEIVNQLTKTKNSSGSGNIFLGGNVSIIPSGRRNDELARLAGALRRQGCSDIEIIAQLQTTNKLRCIPPLPDDEVARIARSIARYSPAPSFQPTALPTAICLASVAATPVNWLWEPYIPMHSVTLMEGDPGVGKTYLALDIAARVTRGQALINDPATPTAGNVLFLTAEDSLEQTVRPRFEKLGGDVNKMYSLTELISLNNPDTMEHLLATVQPKLVIIDPIQAYLGEGVDMHRANHIRPILSKLKELATNYNSAFILLRHLSKSNNKAAYRGMGSIDFRAAARSVLLIAEDPGDISRRVIIHSKSSLSATGPSLSYAVSQTGLVFHGITSVTADDLDGDEHGRRPNTQTATEPDKCPTCAGQMRLRTNRQDPSKKFYGCSNYPNCQTTLPAGGTPDYL